MSIDLKYEYQEYLKYLETHNKHKWFDFQDGDKAYIVDGIKIK